MFESFIPTPILQSVYPWLPAIQLPMSKRSWSCGIVRKASSLCDGTQLISDLHHRIGDRRDWWCCHIPSCCHCQIEPCWIAMLSNYLYNLALKTAYTVCTANICLHCIHCDIYAYIYCCMVETLVHDKLWELSGVRSAGGTNVSDGSYPKRLLQLLGRTCSAYKNW